MIFHYNVLKCIIICAILFMTRKEDNVHKAIIYTPLMVYEAIIGP